MHERTPSTITFSEYGKTFQEKIIQALIVDHRWASQVQEVMRVEYFEFRYLQYLAERIVGYYARYKCFPSFENLITVVRDDLKGDSDEVLRMHVIEFLSKVRQNPNVNDLPYVKEKTLDFCRKQEIKESLERIVDRVESADYDQIVEDLNRAVNKGSCESIGHSFEEDREARFIEQERHPIPTGIDEIDCQRILRGGLGRGELGVVVAPTGVGKSHALVHFGAEALLRKKNVIHYTFELSENAIGLRYDSHITGIESNKVPMHKEEVMKREDEMNLGKLIIKGYPTGTATIQTLRAHIERCTLQGHKPDLILIDYADIMRSTRKYDAPRFELKLIYEELRNLAMTFDLPIWTASQANREASTADVVGLENMSEAYGKAMVADVVISLSRKPDEKATGLGRLFVAKNRAGQDGIVYPVKINTACSYISVLEGADSLSLLETQQNDQQALKDSLRQKWGQIRKDKQIPSKPLPKVEDVTSTEPTS